MLASWSVCTKSMASIWFGMGTSTRTNELGRWLAGQVALTSQFALLYAPTVNSYKRYQSESFAPTRIVAGRDNRTCGFRLCGRGQGGYNQQAGSKPQFQNRRGHQTNAPRR